jgi:Peptidase A4 family
MRSLLPRFIAFGATAAALVCALVAPAAARAATNVSDNWSGYAIHGAGIKFEQASGSWRQPAATCTTGDPTYSAFWVGIGGYNLTSQALEQIGTELDCGQSGDQQLSAWYELVPAPSRTIRMTVHPGDLMTATVAIAGSRVTLTLRDRTTHRRFRKTITDHAIDQGSAEWIAEAPSECVTSTRCRTLPLTDFGSMDFSGATVKTASGKTSAISNRRWTTSKIVLNTGANGPTFVSYGGGSDQEVAKATPSSLETGGKDFKVSFSESSSNPPTDTGGYPAGYGGGYPGGSYYSTASVEGHHRLSVSGHQRLVQGVRAGPR